MKKWVVGGISFLLILVVIFAFKIYNRGNPAGEAISEGIGLNITILYPAPILEIVKPTNGTYLSNNNIVLSFTSSYASSIWYNIDNGTNTTIASTVYFNTTAGSHTLFLYANNSNSTTAKNVTFFVNTSKFYIIDDEYEIGEDSYEDEGNMARHQKKGQSTDFLNYSYEELQNLDNIILDNADNGKISFNEAINLTNDSTPNDDYIDLNNYINISFNKIELNSIALPNFNKPATLTMYGLTFTNPRILKDGSVCPSSICTENSYSGGTLSFDVTGFSVYSTEETPSSSGTGQATGSGGGAVSNEIENFTLNEEALAIDLKQGQTKEKIITITNTGTKDLNVSIENKNLEDFIRISDKEFIIKAKESVDIHIDFLAKENIPQGNYLGKLIIGTKKLSKEILVSIGVESQKPLFDVSLEVPDEYLEVIPGNKIMLKLEIFNLGGIKKTDVNIEYVIKNGEGSIITSNTETAAIETKASFIKELDIPSNEKIGPHLVYAKVSYNGEIASASHWIYVVKEKQTSSEMDMKIAYGLIIMIIITLLVIFYKLRKIKKDQKLTIDGFTLLKHNMIKKKR